MTLLIIPTVIGWAVLLVGGAVVLALLFARALDVFARTTNTTKVFGHWLLNRYRYRDVLVTLVQMSETERTDSFRSNREKWALAEAKSILKEAV